MNDGTNDGLTPAPPLVSTPLAEWNTAIEETLTAGDVQRAIALAQVVLKRLPRHLHTYQQLLRAAWLLKHWAEGEDWGRRLLRADPGHAQAWQMLALAAEQRHQRGQAHAMWQRAFEAAPYAPEIRAGLGRTTLHGAPVERSGVGSTGLSLNLACLARLYLRGRQWTRAAPLYRKLIQADGRRIDFQLGLMTALWQQHLATESCQLARVLVRNHPHLLMAWAALDALGDENDRALARSPLETMDPDGAFVGEWLGLPYERRSVTLMVSQQESARLISRAVTGV